MSSYVILIVCGVRNLSTIVKQNSRQREQLNKGVVKWKK